MRLLVDACAGVRLAEGLQSFGHEVEFIGSSGRDPSDEEFSEPVMINNESSSPETRTLAPSLFLSVNLIMALSGR